MPRDVVMDIDFDYCVRPTLASGYSDRSRQPDTMQVWLSADALVNWLKQNNLFHPESFAGAVESHERVLAIWSDWLASGKLRIPFDLLHIDAHPDMMEIDGAVASRLDANPESSVEECRCARAGNFLQYAVRLGWIHRIWMLFPDDEYERIDALASSGADGLSKIVKKPVEAIAKGPSGGADLWVRIGARLIEISLHTRMTLPPVGPLVATVLAHSPEFVPRHADAEYVRLAQQLRGVPC